MPNQILIDPSTQKPVEVNPQEAQTYLQKGFYVPLQDDSGNIVAADYQEAQNLVRQGTHAQPSSQDLQHLIDTDKFGSASQQALTFIEGALEPNTLGAYGKVAEASGLTTAENIRKRQEINPGTHALGEVAGIVGGVALAPETSIPGLIAKAGNAAKAGIAAEGFFGKAAQLAAQNAIEGGLFTATHEMSEKLLGDPNSTAEHMMANIGLGAALGGGLGVALSPMAFGAEKLLNKTRGMFATTKTAKDLVESGASIPDVLPTMGESPEVVKNIMKGLTELKPNSSEIQAAGNRLGAPVLESQISSSKFVQDLDSSLMNGAPTMSAIKRQQLVNEGFQAVEDNLSQALGGASGMSKAEVGAELKKGLVNSLSEETAAIGDIFNRVKEMGQDIALDAKAIKSTAKDMTNIEGLMSSTGKPLSESSPGYQLAKRVSEELPNLGTVDDLRLYAQRIGQDTIGKPELRYVAGQIQNKLADLIEGTTINFAKQTLPDASVLIEQHGVAKAAYKGLREEIDALGGAIGKKLRKGEGPQAFIDWLEKTPDEKVAEKLFTKDNNKFLSFLNERFPEQFELLKNLKKQQFLDAPGVVKDQVIQPGALIRQIDKLEPEVKKLLFTPEELQKIADSKTWIEALPKNINPSGTAKAMQFFDWIKNPFSATAAQASDFIKTKLIQSLVKNSPGEAPMVNALIHMADMSHKLARNIERHSGGIFGKATQTLIDENTKKERKPANEPVKMNKIGTMVQKYMADPESLVSHMSNNLMPISDKMPDTTSAFNSSIGTAISFLASKLPNTDKAAPLDKPNQPSNSDIAKFNRYAEVVDNPVSVLTRVKNGTILPQDLETLNTVYPQLYNSMKQVVMEKLVDHASKKNSQIPYQTKLGLSMFLGQDLDSTISPQSIMNNQMVLTVNELQNQQQAQQMAGTKPSKTGMGKMKRYENDQTISQSAAMRKSATRSI